MDNKELRLQNLLRKMDVPNYKMNHYQWLVQHLGERNSQNSHYQESMELLLEILDEKNLIRKKEQKKILSSLKNKKELK